MIIGRWAGGYSFAADSFGALDGVPGIVPPAGFDMILAIFRRVSGRQDREFVAFEHFLTAFPAHGLQYP